MKYDVHANDFSLASGTCLQGRVLTSYDKLVKAFGKPGPGDEYKTDAEWVVRFEDGEIATVYNWKNGKSYCGPNGYEIEDIPEWNIGGKSRRAVSLIKFVLQED